MDKLNLDLLKLNLISGLGAIKINKLINSGFEVTKLKNYDQNYFYELGIDPTICQKLEEQNLIEKIKQELKEIESRKIKLVNYQQRQYPTLLKEIYSTPPLLYYKGKLPSDEYFFLAVVGARKASKYGVIQTKRIIKELANYWKKIVIVSGLAYGIDTIAHQTALDCGLKTIAVLGSGLGELYPKDNFELAQNIIKEGGAVISEFSTLTNPKPTNFPIRNRIISGLSSATLVLEAGSRSGALITARQALEQNREIFALPGPVDLESYKGCNNLIKQGARLLSCADDILETLTFQKILPQQNKNKDIEPKPIKFLESLSDEEQKILLFLQKRPASMEEVVNNLKFSVTETMQYLTTLELKDLLREEVGGVYHPVEN